ncbi:hypothetical protein GJ744_010412 [Endocarpon pusillum]|uniref:Uncharacterized protein n=1 Tax=Endocarpon pusillum TaxID=364733 RepID=A0A8H7AI10_9EURO|nr:hypothetical protein GJ744_010412 [Endocarpon pusillum]
MQVQGCGAKVDSIHSQPTNDDLPAVSIIANGDVDSTHQVFAIRTALYDLSWLFA